LVIREVGHTKSVYERRSGGREGGRVGLEKGVPWWRSDLREVKLSVQLKRKQNSGTGGNEDVEALT